MPSVGENWKCPYCGHAQVITEERYRTEDIHFWLKGWKHGHPALRAELIACANNECEELTLGVQLLTFVTRDVDQLEYRAAFKHWGLLPASSAKSQPDYIPQPIRTDYYEGCAIRELSPKASATIIRRCLQGMIRDFCGISKRRLIDEIRELRERVNHGRAPPGVLPDTVDAIDQVRKIGNIGAHMEADINVIVDVDPNEAQVLVELAELLFEEWYVAAELRKRRLEKLSIIADENKAIQQQKILPSPDGAAD